MSTKVVLSPAEQELLQRMQKARDEVLAVVMRFDGPDQPLNILESAIVEVVKARCRGFMAKAIEMVGERIAEKMQRQARQY
jgi:hypothetical protein